jgi:4-amino-4-deoxy-L-arabinose transferase-like glycosyltransferase
MIVIKRWSWPILVGLTGWLAVAFTRADPGLTADEPFSVIYGIDFVSRLSERGWDFFSPASINETFAERKEHPPLGRWLVGGMGFGIDFLSHLGDHGWGFFFPSSIKDTFAGTVARWQAKQHAASPYGIQDILDSRLAPATAFAVLLALVVRVVGGQFGMVAGVSSGISLLLMPRSFAHAHFAALETFVSMTYFLGVISAAWMMERRWPWLLAPVAGLFLGFALLTKIHGVFLPPLVAIWAISCHRFRSLVPLTIWGLMGIAVFFLGWPWLWKDVMEFWGSIHSGVHSAPRPFPRLSEFLGASLDRAAIYVSYPGGKFRDTEVPWHYTWVMFAVVVPVGIHLLGGLGVWQHVAKRRGDHRNWLFLGAVVFPLTVFSIPRIPVYDGVRLFLMVFPFWALFAGQGAAWLFEHMKSRWGPRVAGGLLAAFLACQAVGVVHYHPFQLSYYNLLVGGLRGAQRLGFEVTYWGDTITTDLLDRWSAEAPENACAVLVPTLYDGNAELYQSSSMLAKHQKLTGRWGSNCPYVLVYNRRAYLDRVQELIDNPKQKPLFENAIDGVWLSRVYLWPSDASQRVPTRSMMKMQ